MDIAIPLLSEKLRGSDSFSKELIGDRWLEELSLSPGR
jgi:hypothetical protein